MDARTYKAAAQRLRDKWGDKAGPALDALGEFERGEFTVEDVALAGEEMRRMQEVATARRRAVATVMFQSGATQRQVAEILNMSRGSVSEL